MAALLTSEAERGATTQVVKYINDCKEMGIRVLPPDVNSSDFHFTVSGNEIRFGLSAVKNVGEAAVREILRERARRGKFGTPFDVAAGVDSRLVNKKVLESLIKAGAFDSLGWRRSQCFHLIDAMIEYSHDVQKLRLTPQALLFGGGQLEAPKIPPEVEHMREWDESLFLSYERDALGFFITGHPLAAFEKRLKKLTSHAINELDEERDFNKEVRVAGIINTIKLLKNKKDERFAVFVLEDLSGRVDVTAFPEVYNKYYEYLREGQLVWARGKFMGEGENRRVHLLEIMPLADAFQKKARRVILRIFLPGLEETVIGELRDLLERNPGECPVFFELETPHSYRLVVQSIEVRSVFPSEDLTRNVERLLGEDSVFIEY